MSANGYASKISVLDRYEVVGFISSGTYGRVYKAVGVKGQAGEFAIKKLEPQISRVRSSGMLISRAGSNRTKKENWSSILAYPNLLAVKWLFVLNSTIPM